MQSFRNALASGCVRVCVFSLEYSLLHNALYSLWSVLFGLILLVVMKIIVSHGELQFHKHSVYGCEFASVRVCEAEGEWESEKKLYAKLSSAGRFSCSEITKLYIPQSIRSHTKYTPNALLPPSPLLSHLFNNFIHVRTIHAKYPACLVRRCVRVCVYMFTPISYTFSLHSLGLFSSLICCTEWPYPRH